MKVAIFTMFNGLDRTYSLVNVVGEHLQMLLDANIKTKLLVSEHCLDSDRTGIYLDKRIEWAKVVNTVDGKNITWYDYSQPKGEVHETFYKEVDLIAKDLVKKLLDIDVCIMHDIHFLGWHLVHNLAIRKAQQELQNVKFIAFTHSVPFSPEPNSKWPFSARYTPMPKTTYVYPSQCGISALAKQYNVSENNCSVINNTLNLLEDMSDEVKDISKKFDLLSPDILIIYPARLTPGKKQEKVVALAGSIKKATEKSVKVIFCDFPSMDIKSESYKNIIRELAYSFGLNTEDIAFTTDLGYPNGFPRKGVLELFTLSNLFICPSYSESFGLIVLEAASRGNFLVLNQAVPALKEIGEDLNAYFMRWDARNFGFNTRETYHSSEQEYYEDHGQKIVNLINKNPVINSKTIIRQRYNPKWVFKNQLKPLLK
ncbi:glycosyltransferase [Tepidibacter aestuarii]|uniref:glycosyltransferase n=1 Tax=Tepidibacter aestuarii TaxID=2925782 RepID=UPI0020C100A3|nr:glycosyltransferase [Tepidibacter aestuarii]CAH2214315.1 Glycosyltransferase involved in cell wall biosynthesis [Tepidibacter aestuarii]